MNPFEMVVAIIIVVTIGRVLQARYGVHRDAKGNEYRVDPGESAEAARLRDEVRTLKERVQVLERVITENHRSSDLEREIEQLRDKNRV